SALASGRLSISSWCGCDCESPTSPSLAPSGSPGSNPGSPPPPLCRGGSRAVPPPLAGEGGHAKHGGGGETMIGRLNHVAIVVPDLAAAAALYRDALRAEVSPPHPLPAHGVTVVFVELPNSKIELLQPLGDASPVRGFLERNPAGGMHHICYE